MKLRNPPRFGAVSMYRLLASVHAGEPVQPGDAELTAGHGRRDALLSRYAAPEKYAFARETPVWDELGPPYQLPDGQWRAAYAHGMSVPLTDSERDELQARHQRNDHDATHRQDPTPDPQQPPAERSEVEG